ncbi:MAG TPA: tetratricopeptide repeat protein [Bryobacteraceae bacterium]|jgi:tetratricopeptide (TPR) repeat protein|nr:tetratricopeptide repeat protein [Bryobacteraceae bacterium]
MPHPKTHFLSRTSLFLLSGLVAVPLVAMAASQNASPTVDNAQKLPPSTKQASSLKASAYYHFAIGHLYEDLAANSGGRSEYVDKAIENFRQAMKEDPSAGFLVEDIAELYRISGRLRDAVEEAQTAIKNNPDDLNARKVLAHIYTQQIGDSQSNRVDENMARKAIEQYKYITQKDPKDVESLVMLGRLDRVVDDSVSAEAAFKQALAAEPDDEDAVVGLASVYSDRGDPKTASGLLEKLAQKNPSPRSLVILANDYESMHEYALAADAYKKAVDMDPNRVELKQAMAQDLALAGRYDDALKTYAELMQANPQDSTPYLRSAQIYREQKKVADARKMINKAKELDGDNPEVLFADANLLSDEGKTTDAIAELKALLDKTASNSYDPQHKAARVEILDQLGGLYRKADQTEQAVAAYRQIETLDPDLAPRAEAEVVETYRLAHQYPKAQEASEAADKKWPKDQTLIQVRAQLLADEGKVDPAVAEFKKLLGGKNDRDIWLYIADTYQKGKNWSEMEKAIDQADKLSTSKEDKVNVLFVRGEMYERQKKYEQAERIFRQVIEQDPNNASALNYLGYMLADRNVRLDEAQQLIRKAVDLDPNNYAFLDSLGWVYYRMNKLDDAEQQLSRSIQLMSKDPTIHDHLGDVYFKQGKTRQAIAQWQSSLEELNNGGAADAEPDELAKVQKKLDNARVRLAKEQGPARVN